MKKFFKISVIVILTLALAATVFAVTGTSSGIAARTFCPNVGWNSRIAPCTFTLSPLQDMKGLAYLPAPNPTPDVGWHS